jgi:hypothetical protein
MDEESWICLHGNLDFGDGHWRERSIFGFVDAALLQPLPYASPERLMSVNESNSESPRWPLSYPDYLDWQRLNKSFSSLDVYSGSGYLLRTPSGAVPVQGERVSGGFFQTLSVRPMIGRDFYPGEDRPGGANVVILSYGAWLHRFGARSNLIGQTVDLDNEAYTIIGVLPRAFSFAHSGDAEFWVPLNKFSPHEKMRTFYNFWGIGRLRDGVTAQAAESEVATITKQLQQQYAITGRDRSASIVPLSEIITGDVRPILLGLLGGAGLLLLIACVNVASLVLVRSESRRREIATRGALGASPVRLVRQFVTEGLLLALTGSIASVFVASGLMKLLAHLVPKDMAANMPFLEPTRCCSCPPRVSAEATTRTIPPSEVLFRRSMVPPISNSASTRESCTQWSCAESLPLFSPLWQKRANPFVGYARVTSKPEVIARDSQFLHCRRLRNSVRHAILSDGSLDYFSFSPRICGVKVTPSSSPSGEMRRLTVWPHGSFLFLTSIRYPSDSRLAVAFSTLSTSNSSQACGTGMLLGQASLPKHDSAA